MEIDKRFKTAYAPQSRAGRQYQRTLLQAQQTFSCFLFKGSHRNALHSPPYQSSKTV